VAVLDVPPQVLSRNVTYGSSFFGSMVYILDVSVQGLWRVVTFCADRQVFQVCVHCLLFSRVFSEDVRHERVIQGCKNFYMAFSNHM
jgi:hypothetical protein